MVSIRVFSLLIIIFVLIICRVDQTRSEPCHTVRPVRYSYLNGSFTSLESPSTTDCATPITRDTQVYLTCSSSILFDGNPGPADFSGADSADYYIWNNSQNSQMLFTFARNFTLTEIRTNFYYYGDGRPKLRFYLVEDSFQVWDSTNADHISTTFDNMRLSQNNTRRETNTKRIPGVTSKILLVSVSDKKYRTVLSEITFCTDEFNPETTPSTVAPLTTTMSTNNNNNNRPTTSGTGGHETTTILATTSATSSVSTLAIGISSIMICLLIIGIVVGVACYFCWHKKKSKSVTLRANNPDGTEDNLDGTEEEDETNSIDELLSEEKINCATSPV